MNVILLGYPGSGKGTQAKVLAQKFGLFHVSTGDIFREELAKKTPLGQEVAGYLSAGRLVPDKLVLEVLKTRLATETRGLLFDGFPRTVEQAEGLDSWLDSRSMAVDAVIFINVPEAEVAKRLGDRRTCLGCGKIYNMGTRPPAKADACDVCAKKLITREDDKPEVIIRRLQVYRDQTEPLLAYYRASGNFNEVDGGRNPESVAADIAGMLKGK
ncbi:MAG: adenylate kinase [Elusimicrobia bacterium RIFOXYA2_FULL_58_8]|nr:MAG: adenylate kinase [Elusimicrobia bacterium RIFOXYA2_FULL_58_8]OGS13466.1 MAG: adenylate kinase [Elusimicrobia bacterium RIFOXYA12_FULL_57_11]